MVGQDACCRADCVHSAEASHSEEDMCKQNSDAALLRRLSQVLTESLVVLGLAPSEACHNIFT
jgi:hypothetical protein